MAEYTLANPAHLAKIPEGLDFVAAASVPRAALTSWQSLRDVKEGSSVLITGASGAVGRMGVQITKRKVGEKGKVVAVGGKGSAGLKELGVDIVVNYREVEDWVGELRKEGLVDVLYDCVGEKTLEKSLELVRDRGRIVTVASPPPEYADVSGWDELKGRGVDGGFLMVSESGEDLGEIGELIKDGAVKTSVSFVVDGLSEEGVQDGWRRALKGGIGGSVVVKVL
jgi:NADPH:quinone reductase-like Zn-dependent oxidoreductase